MTTTDEAPAGPPSSPTPSRGLGSLLFRAPAPESIPTPSPGPDTSPSLPDPAASSPSASGWSPAADPSERPGDLTSSPASWADEDDAADAADLDGDLDGDGAPAGRSGGPLGPVVSKAAMKKTFRQGVLITGGMAHKFGARTPGQVAAGLYLADADDAAGIGDPLAEIAQRREGLGQALSPDANNALQAAMALGGYIAKQLAALRIAAEHDAALTPGAEPQATPGTEPGAGL